MRKRFSFLGRSIDTHWLFAAASLLLILVAYELNVAVNALERTAPRLRGAATQMDELARNVLYLRIAAEPESPQQDAGDLLREAFSNLPKDAVIFDRRDDAVEITIDAINPSALLERLETVVFTYGLTIIRMEMTNGDEEGKVRFVTAVRR